MDIAVRLGAACVMTAASAWGGRMMACTQARRAETLRAVLAGTRRLSVEMLERRTPVREALAACGGAFAETAGQMEGGAPPGEAYEQAIIAMRERGGLLDSLEEGDLAALRRLFSGLGEGGLQAQRLVLNEAAEELERLAGQARRKKEEHGKLYTSLGALAGLAAALMLL